MKRVLFFAALVAGCHFDSVGRDSECERLVEDLAECAQVDLVPSDCSVISQDDVRALAAAVNGAGCDFVMDALPGDGDLRASSCRLYGQGCASRVQSPPSYAPARYPIVLVNGIDVSPLFGWSDRIVRVLEEHGQRVYLGTLPGYTSVQVRSAELRRVVEEVRAESGAEKVNLICHSFGGFDCRYLVSPGGLGLDIDVDSRELASQVASITTVGTAHHGTPIADAVLGYLPAASPRDAARALATWIGEWFGVERIEQDAELRAALTALTEVQTASFNAAIEDAEGVYYQSWAGFSRPYGDYADDTRALAVACMPDTDASNLAPWNGVMDYMATPLVGGADIVGEDIGRDSDGLCPVDSARWGVFRGCLPADHMEQLGQQRLPDVNVRTGFDIAWFYADVAADLAGRGL